MRNLLPIVVGAVVVGGGAIAIYNATGGKNDPMNRTYAPAASTPAEPAPGVVTPAAAATPVEAPPPAATFSTVEIGADEAFLGKADAPVTIIEYASMTCPHCAQFHNTVLPVIKSEFIDKGQVRLVYRDFPLDNLALTASVVARCSGPDRFFPFVDTLYKSQSNWSRDRNPMVALSRIARLGGMSQADFEACLKNDKITEKVLAQRLDADKTYGVRSTPTIIVNGDLYRGGLSAAQLRAVIKSKLK